MADSSMGLHEDRDDLRPQTLERHRGLVSLMEELEAIDWYQQRIDATGDPVLREVLTHNRDEEAEHAAMTLEWLRRDDPALDVQLRAYLFSEGSIVAVEEQAESADDGDPASDGSLGIGSLRGRDRS